MLYLKTVIVFLVIFPILGLGLAANSADKITFNGRAISTNPELYALALNIRSRLQLTPEEQNWLNTGPKVNVRVGDYAPFQFVSEGIPKGLGIDYMQIICIVYELDCNYVSGLNVADSIRSMTEPNGITVQVSWQRNSEREKLAIFTQAYISSPFVIFTRKESTHILGMEDLAGKKIVVEKDYAIHNLIKENFPKLKLIEVDNSTSALETLASGQADAYISSLMAGHYLGRKLGLSNIIVAAPTPFEANQLGVAVRKDWPQLAGLIHKAMTSMTDEQHFQLRDHWLNIPISGFIKINDLLWFGSVIAGGIVLVMLLTARLTIRRMRQGIEARKKAEKNLQISELRLREAMQGTETGLWEWNPQTREVYLDPVWFTMLGYEPDTMPHTFETFEALVHPDDKDTVLNKISSLSEESRAQFDFEYRMHSSDKSYRWIHSKGRLLSKDQQGKPLRLIGIHTDITERKKSEQAILNYQQRLKDLAGELTRTQERERRLIATQLHDNVGQSLALMRIQLATALKQTHGRQLETILLEISDSLRQAVDDTRNIISSLSSPTLNELGLSAAIAEYLNEQVTKRYTLNTRFSEDEQPKPLDDDSKAILYRNVRELLMNVVKHAQASNVSVMLKREADNIKIEVEDDGVGLDELELSERNNVEGFGLFSIEESMKDIGGEMTIESKKGQGLRFSLTAPLEDGKTKAI